MKKVFFVVCMAVSVSAFGQIASDYFPAQEGYRWDYIGSNGQITDRYICGMIDKIDGGSAIGFVQESLGVQNKILYYVIEDTGVFEVSVTDNRGNLSIREKPLIHLSLHERNWQEEDRGDEFRCLSKKTSVSFDGKTYSDCIVVERAIILENGRLLMVKRQYFARGIGLVYVTLQNPSDSAEKPFLRLASYNF